MYFLNGRAACVETVFALAKNDVETMDLAGLKTGYQRLVERVQPDVPVVVNGALTHVRNRATTERLLSQYLASSSVNDFDLHIELTDESIALQEMEIVEGMLSELRAEAPALWETIFLVTNTIFYCGSRHANGGSTSGAVGVLWLNTPSRYPKEDFFELLVHESTHTHIFLDEWRFQHYTSMDEVAKPELWSTSAILAEKRPLDKVLHSIVVATEVLSYREGSGRVALTTKIHPSSAVMREGALRAIDEIAPGTPGDELLTPRSRELVERCAARLERVRLAA